MSKRVLNTVQGIKPIRNRGHWGFINDDWVELVGYFDIEDRLPIFNVYYKASLTQGHCYSINKHMVERDTFIWCYREEMEIERSEYLV